MKSLSIAAALLCALHSVCAQNKTYLGFEFALTNDIYRIADNGEFLHTVPLIGGLGGLIIRQELGRSIFLETGLIFKENQEGFGFKAIPFNSVSSGDISFIIPIRVGLNLNLYDKKAFLVPVIGYSCGINPPFGYGVGFGNYFSNATEIVYRYTQNADISRYFNLLQTGVGLEFKINKIILLSISTNYYKGFNKTNQLDIIYKVNNSNQTTGTAISKGEFWSFGAGLKYPISNFWTVNN